MPPRPPLRPASSIMRICLRGVLYARLLSRICRLYDSLKMGRKLHSCLIRPVNIVVRARGLYVCAAAVPAAGGTGSFGRSATTSWFSTTSFTISSSYRSTWIPFSPAGMYAASGGKEGKSGARGVESLGSGGRKRNMRGDRPEELTEF